MSKKQSLEDAVEHAANCKTADTIYCATREGVWDAAAETSDRHTISQGWNATGDLMWMSRNIDLIPCTNE